MLLKCTVCQGSFRNKSEWLGHLLLPSHLTLARKELPSWGEAERACTLVIFAKQAVGKDLQIIQHLSQDLRTFVTDFVWWEERPRLGFAQFESKEKVKEVLASLKDLKFRIGPDQLCQVRDGGTVSELEWLQLHPDMEMDNDTVEPPPPNPNPKLSPVTPPPCDGEPAPKRIKTEKAAGHQRDDPGVGKGTPKSKSSAPEDSLRGHLSSIRKLIEIPDTEYNAALDITRRLQQVLDENKPKPSKGWKNKRAEPGVGAHSEREAVISRHWRLKLQYSPRAPAKDKNIPFGILICKYFINFEDPFAGAIEMQELTALEKKLITPGEGGKKLFLSYEVISTKHAPDPKTGFSSMLRYCVVEPSTSLPFQVSLLSDRRLLVEVQVWRLFEYLLTFDPRCTPVTQVVYYWAKTNSVTVGKTTGNHDDLPDPSGLNWLLILFFAQEGIIPSPNEVLEQPHDRRLYNGVDIGFSDSASFSNAWKSKSEREDADEEQFAEEVFKLLYKFFQFCATRLGRPSNQGCGWVVNTRDAVIIPAEDVAGSSAIMDNFKMSEVELSTIKCQKVSAKVIMLQPMFPNWRISTTTVGPCIDAMRKSGMKFKNYFEPKSKTKAAAGVRVKRERLGLGDFLNLLQL